MVYTLWPKRRTQARVWGALPVPQLAPQLRNMTFVQFKATPHRRVQTRRGTNWGQHGDRGGHSMPPLGRGRGAAGGVTGEAPTPLQGQPWARHGAQACPGKQPQGLRKQLSTVLF